MVASDLVKHLLIGRAWRVAVSWSALQDLVKASRIDVEMRDLCVTTSDILQHVGVISEFQRALSKLPKLELLNIRACSYLASELLLPTTITSLSLGKDTRTCWLRNLGELPLLHLAISVQSRNEEDLHFLATSKWSYTLTSLNLDGTGCGNAEYLSRCLPKNLLSLEVGGGFPASDASLAISGQTRLERLVCGFYWSVESSLPGTLHTLKICHLMVPVGQDADDLVNYIPPSVTKLKFGGISRYNADARSSFRFEFSSFVKLAEHTLPSLSLSSAARLMCQYYHRRTRHSVDEHGEIGSALVEKMAIAKLEAAGLDKQHLNWFASVDAPLPLENIKEHTFARLVAAMPTAKDAAFLLKFVGGINHAPCDECSHHYPELVKCLEWGVCNSLVLDSPQLIHLNAEAIMNLTQLEIKFSFDRDVLESFLGTHVFTSVSTLVISFPVNRALQVTTFELLRVIHRRRMHFPRLDVIDLANWSFKKVPVDFDLLLLMAQMNMYNVGDSYSFTYHVRTPRQWLLKMVASCKKE
jgi:hypothetical protein